MEKLTRSAANVVDNAGKMNCWDHKKCGRQPGGNKVAELGVCPVTTYAELHGTHGGKNGGRACWAVAGSLCGGKIQGSYAQKLHNCWRCDFMNTVKKEEEPMPLGFSATRLGMDKALEKQGRPMAGMRRAAAREAERQ